MFTKKPLSGTYGIHAEMYDEVCSFERGKA